MSEGPDGTRIPGAVSNRLGVAARGSRELLRFKTFRLNGGKD
jgi:hypothetical protein